MCLGRAHYSFSQANSLLLPAQNSLSFFIGEQGRKDVVLLGHVYNQPQ